jgi:hypothetical protein
MRNACSAIPDDFLGTHTLRRKAQFKSRMRFLAPTGFPGLRGLSPKLNRVKASSQAGVRVGTPENKERTVRFFRLALVVPIALSSLALMSSPASARTGSIATHLSIGQAELGRFGISISVPLRFTCDPTLNVAFGDVSVTQVSGHKLAQGTGAFSNAFPGVPCTGKSEKVTVQVNATGAFAFRVGKKAIGSADLNVYDPVSGNLYTTSVSGQAITITR